MRWAGPFIYRRSSPSSCQWPDSFRERISVNSLGNNNGVKTSQIQKKGAGTMAEVTRIVKKARELAKPFRVTDGESFRLKDIDPGDTLDLKSEDKPRAKEALALSVQALAALQDMLYAEGHWGLLLIFQAMDAAGKDGAIKHVMSGLNPQGVEVYSFKSPSAEDLNHDYLWRCMKRLPERGRVGIFNRSYYEETLVVRVHPEFLTNEKLPPELITKNVWKDRFQDIRSFERYLVRNGI